ncbi:DUF7079 family protein [Pseudomonas migulae]|uniref:DUF7079 family protein n=1 Tax=Pseudomonas migulae TaxID=78543 RepID=UPI003B8A8FFC
MWTGFDTDSLNVMIEERHAARRNYWFRRQFDKLLVRWLSYHYGYIWKEIVSRF